MSTFLAPIHYLMNDRIIYLEDMAMELNDKLDLQVDFDLINRGDLKEIIDLKNIHGFLNERVNKVEKSFAIAISKAVLLNKKEELLSYMYDKGCKTEFKGGPEEAYNIFSNIILSGMPCDRAIEAYQDEDGIFFKDAKNIHDEYYNYGVESQIYFECRNEWIRGLIEKSDLKLQKLEDYYLIKEN